MEQRFLDLLPLEAQELVQRIEAHTGIPIDVQRTERPPNLTLPNPYSPGAEVYADRAVILHYGEDHLDAHALVHELLHIERYWVEGVPQIVPIGNATDDHWSITSSIENAIEHLAIVPRESDYGYDPYPHWNFVEGVIWGRYPWPDITHPFARRKNMLLGWLGVSILTTDAALKEHARSILARESVLGEAERFRAKIDRVKGSKVRALAATVRFLQIPPTEVALRYHDTATKSLRHERLPAYA